MGSRGKERGANDLVGHGIVMGSCLGEGSTWSQGLGSVYDHGRKKETVFDLEAWIMQEKQGSDRLYLIMHIKRSLDGVLIFISLLEYQICHAG
jgi:hypothetical protein